MTVSAVGIAASLTIVFFVVIGLQAAATGRAWEAQQQAEAAQQQAVAAAPVQAPAPETYPPASATPEQRNLYAMMPPFPAPRRWQAVLDAQSHQAAPVQQAAAPVPQAAPMPPAAAAYSPPPQAAYAPVQDPEIPGGQTTPSTVAPQPAAPTPDPATAMRRVNADYATGLYYYNDALRRLKELNGAGMTTDSILVGVDCTDIAQFQNFCSPADRAKAKEMSDDLWNKATDLETAAKSSPTGGDG